MSTWFFVTHSETPLRTEKRFSNSSTIAQVKVCLSEGTLYGITGTPDSRMKLQLKDEEGGIIEADMDDNKKLEDYEIFDHAELHVVDKAPSTTFQEINDPSAVEKFTISDEEYNKRDDSFRKFKEQHKELFKVFYQFFHPKAKSTAPEVVTNITSADIGKRCQISGDRRGTVRYVGPLGTKPGVFVGIELDEPLGRNNGSFEGKKLFECEENHGVFIRPKEVEVGDFPPIEI